MILRFFRVIVHPGYEDDFKTFFLGTALPGVRSHSGLVSVMVGLPHASAPREFSMVMVWRDLAALKEFTGEGWQEAVIHPDEVHMLEATHLYHYDLANV